MQSSSEDLYQVLGISRDASDQDIKKAFKKLAMKYHPDRGGDAEMFKKINEAYAVLSNPEKKAAYDRFGTVDMSNMQMPNMDELFENLFGFSFGGDMGGIFGNGMSQSSPHMFRQEKKSPEKEDVIEVSLEEVMKGSVIDYKIRRKVYLSDGNSQCRNCKGRGQVLQQMNIGMNIITQNVSLCHECRGLGCRLSENNSKIEEENIQVPLPKGIPDGNRLVIRNKGDHYPDMPRGDIILTVKYKKHPLFEPDPHRPHDLIHVIRCNLYEFMYGFDRYIRLLDDRLLHIYHPKDSGSLVKSIDKPLIKTLKNYGFHFRGNIGHLHLHFKIIFPVSPSSVFKDILLTEYPPSNQEKPPGQYNSINIFSL